MNERTGKDNRLEVSQIEITARCLNRNDKNFGRDPKKVYQHEPKCHYLIKVVYTRSDGAVEEDHREGDDNLMRSCIEYFVPGVVSFPTSVRIIMKYPKKERHD